jgi:hypothetical protein
MSKTLSTWAVRGNLMADSRVAGATATETPSVLRVDRWELRRPLALGLLMLVQA